MPTTAINAPPAISANCAPGSVGGWPERGKVLEQSRVADVVEVVAGALAVGAVLPIAAERADDEARNVVAGAQRLVVQPQPRHHAGAVALNQHVGALGHTQQRLTRGGLLEVERRAALVAVHRQEELADAILPSGGMLREGSRPGPGS